MPQSPPRPDPRVRATAGAAPPVAQPPPTWPVGCGRPGRCPAVPTGRRAGCGRAPAPVPVPARPRLGPGPTLPRPDFASTPAPARLPPRLGLDSKETGLERLIGRKRQWMPRPPGARGTVYSVVVDPGAGGCDQPPPLVVLRAQYHASARRPAPPAPLPLSPRPRRVPVPVPRSGETGRRTGRERRGDGRRESPIHPFGGPPGACVPGSCRPRRHPGVGVALARAVLPGRLEAVETRARGVFPA